MSSTLHKSSPTVVGNKKSNIKMGENSIVKLYLLLYNLCEVVGWSYLLVKILIFLTQHGLNTKTLYANIEQTLLIFQTGACLEVLHCMVGFVKSNPVLTGMQVNSRIFMIWGILWKLPMVKQSPSIVLFLLPWCITEVVRYSFYFLSLVGRLPYFIKWCRYSFFILLYPVGVSGELLTIYAALPYIEKYRIWCLDLPNVLNISFDFYYHTWLTIIGFVPVFPYLYKHMLSQRRKIISNVQTPSKLD